MNFKLMFLIALAIVMKSCSAQSKNQCSDFMKAFQEHYKILKKHTWAVTSCFGSEDTFIIVQAITSLGDTFLIVNLTKTINPSRNNRWAYEMEMIKSFQKNSESHSIYYDEKMSLMYHYKILEPSGRKELVLGRYYFDYLFKANSMSLKQRKYFEVNKDSLIMVRGDVLPPLPEK